MPERSPSPRLVLASRSPRRALLLREAGFRFEQADPPFEDPPQPNNDHPGSPGSLAADLARQKALSLKGHVGKDAVILSADTICVGSDGKLIGQPHNRDEAKQMIQHFAHNTHAVITGVALLSEGMEEPEVFADEARVTLGAMNGVQLETYLDSGQWRGKAGGYNLFDCREAGWPLMVEGDETTVVGLPMSRIIPALAKMDIHPTTP